jgi:hypothetical protein
LLQDSNLTEELAFAISNYVRLIQQLDLTMPEPFLLQDVLDANERFTGRPFPGARPKPPEDAESTDPTKREPVPPEEAQPQEPAAEQPAAEQTPPQKSAAEPSPPQQSAPPSG